MLNLKALPLPIALVVLSFLAPTELSVYIAGLRLPPHRLVLLAVFPFAVMRLAGGQVRLKAFDIPLLLYSVWSAGIFTLHAGFEGFVFGGSLALESLGSYVAARAFIRTREQFVAAIGLLMTVVAAAGAIALPETLLGTHFTHDTLQSMTGYVVQRNIEMRKGLTRAYGTFDHPIHLGSFCASVLALSWYTTTNTMLRLRRIAIVLIATLTAVSSAPFLCIGLQAGLMVWEKATRGMRHRVWIAIAVLAGLYIGASAVMTRSPIAFVATGMTLDPWTGFYRLMIWQYGLENVWASPWIGIGQGEWSRPEWMASSTVDAFWLVLMISQGLPAFLLLVTGLAMLTWRVAKRIPRTKDMAERRIARGWVIGFIALALLTCTVHVWNVVYAYLFFFFGSAGWIAAPQRRKAAARKARPIAVEPRPAWAQPAPGLRAPA